MMVRHPERSRGTASILVAEWLPLDKLGVTA